MKKEIVIGQKKLKVIITDKDYLAAGGEAEVYAKGGMTYKLYHDPKNKMLPPQKMQELTVITNPQVVVPQDVIYDAKTGSPLGYTARFIDKVDPILKIFNRAYKTANNIDHQMVAELVKKLQVTLMDIHGAKCLAVDFNELNILLQLGSPLVPWFIDTDSYATPSFKATAIMDSVRDRKATVYDNNGVMHYNPTVLSDWFSWAIISFWIYTNIHPYRGNHKDYKPKDKQKQMDDGISVFHPGVRIPPTVENFQVIPPRHLDWFKLIFERNERSIPPLPDSLVPLLVPAQIITITGTDKIDVVQVAACGDTIISVQQFMGVNYVVTHSSLYAGNNKLGVHDPSKKVLFCPASGGNIVISRKGGNAVEFSLVDGTSITSIRTSDIFERNGAIYTVTNGGLLENTFVQMGSKTIHRMKTVENVSNLSAKIYHGCVIQDLLGKKYLTIPYEIGKCFSKCLAGLDHVRIIDAKSDKNVTVIIGEEKGKFNRYVVVFDKKYQNFEIRVDEDIPYEPINFAVLGNGLCLLLTANDQIQLFSTANQFETLDNPPFDASMPLFSTPNGFFFINGSTIHQIKRK
jgi:hypothetical protein